MPAEASSPAAERPESPAPMTWVADPVMATRADRPTAAPVAAISRSRPRGLPRSGGRGYRKLVRPSCQEAARDGQHEFQLAKLERRPRRGPSARIETIEN